MRTELGRLIRSMRQERGFSLKLLAEKAGVAKSTLIRWESGESQPRLTELNAVMDALQATEFQRENARLLLQAPRGVASFREAGKELGALIPTVGDLVRAMRMRRGLTVEAVAHRLGTHQSMVTRWERGQSTIPRHWMEPLLAAVGAHDEEKTVFQKGTGFLRNEEEAHLTPEEARIRIRTIHQQAQKGDHVLMDLQLLDVQAKLWPQVHHSEEARLALADSYAHYALWLSWVNRCPEAALAADRVMELITGRDVSPGLRFQAVSISALTAAKRKGRRGTSQAVDLLQTLLPQAIDPIWKSSLYREMADYASRSGHHQTALGWINQAEEAAHRSEDPIALRLARFIHAQIHLNAGAPQAALPLLQEAHSQPLQRILESLQWVETLLALDERADAHLRMERVTRLTQRYDYPQFDEAVTRLAQQF